MTPKDFYVGLEFLCGPFWYRCTDIGTRTVIAIRLVEDDPAWYAGPPYMVEEVVLDEVSLEEAYLSEEGAVTAAIKEHETSGHPGFDHDAVSRMLDEKPGKERYPRPRFLEFDRVRGDGEILHPYAACRDAHGEWAICLYLPFTKEWLQMKEVEFRTFPLSTPVAVKTRAKLAD